MAKFYEHFTINLDAKNVGSLSLLSLIIRVGWADVGYCCSEDMIHGFVYVARFNVHAQIHKIGAYSATLHR